MQMEMDSIEDNEILKFDRRNFNVNELHNMMNDDKKFFEHLQSLKSKNSKTLKRLENLYNHSFGYDKPAVNGNMTVKGFSESFRNSNRTISGIKSGHLNKSLSPRHFKSPHSERKKLCSRIKNTEAIVLEDDFSESSEDELDEQLKVKVPEDHVNILPNEKEEKLFRGRSSSYDVISSMWEKFSVDEYIPYTKSKKEKNQNKWSPAVTIPEPFQMSIREERKANTKSKRIEKIKEELIQKVLEEEAELHKQIVPTPVPPTTFLPLYDEIKSHQEKKRQYVKALSKEILKSTEKPFKFIKREEVKKKFKCTNYLDQFHKKQKQEEKERNKFKANPYPEKLFDMTLADREIEKEEYRKIKIKLRSQEMLACSSLPSNMKTRNNIKYPAREKLAKKLEKQRNKSFQPKIYHNIPDFETLQKQHDYEREQCKNDNTPTICEPFNLHTANIPTRRSKFQEAVKTKKILDKSGSSQSMNLSRSTQGSIFNSYADESHCGKKQDPPVFYLNQTTILRQEKIHQDLKKSKQGTLPSKSKAKLQKKIAKSVQASDPVRNREKETTEKRKLFREADYARQKEYNHYLHCMNTKLDDRPLLFERESQINAKTKAMRRYKEILEQAGVDGNILQSMEDVPVDHSFISKNIETNESGHNDDESEADSSIGTSNKSSVYVEDIDSVSGEYSDAEETYEQYNSVDTSGEYDN